MFSSGFSLNQYNQNLRSNKIIRMEDKYIKFCTNTDLPSSPLVAFDTSSEKLVHLYQNVNLPPDNFQSEVTQYLSRKESSSGNVVTVIKI